MKDYAVYYAGPAKTPEGYASGSFGPTTAGRMDAYVDQFQAHGGSLVMLAKGNRSQAVTDACKKHGGFYLGSIGGPAARLAQGLHQEGRGARVRRARDGGGVEDRGRRLPGVHRRRRQGQRLLRGRLAAGHVVSQVVVAVAFAASLLAACGDDAEVKPPAKKDFLIQVNAICDESQKLLAAAAFELGDAPTVDEINEFVRSTFVPAVRGRDRADPHGRLPGR